MTAIWPGCTLDATWQERQGPAAASDTSVAYATMAQVDESIVFSGITACLSVLLVGILIVYVLRLVYQRFPRLPPIPTDSWVFFSVGVTCAVVLQFGYGQRLSQTVDVLDESFPDLFFAVMLPPIIFESGYSLQMKEFASSFMPAAMLAGPGTLISTVVVALLLYLFGLMHATYGFSFLDSLLLGTVVSATDTIAVLTTMDSKGIRRSFYSLVYGESVLNDAVALVAFRVFVSYEKNDVTFLSVLAGFGAFFVVFAGSVVTGVAVAAGAALLFKHGPLRHRLLNAPTMAPAPHNAPADANGHSSTGVSRNGHSAAVDSLATAASEVERTLYCVLPFLSYMIAEATELSGVVATLFCGIVMAYTARKNVSNETREFANGLFRMLANLFESLAFVYIGIATTELGGDAMKEHWPTAVLLVFFCLAGRAVAVWCVSWMVNRIPAVTAAESSLRHPTLRVVSQRPTTQRIGKADRTLLWWCGLRGGVAYALALHAKTLVVDKEAGEVMPIATLFVAVVSLLVIPPAIGPLASKLGLGESAPEHSASDTEPTEVEAIEQRRGEGTVGGVTAAVSNDRGRILHQYSSRRQSIAQGLVQSDHTAPMRADSNGVVDASSSDGADRLGLPRGAVAGDGNPYTSKPMLDRDSTGAQQIHLPVFAVAGAGGQIANAHHASTEGSGDHPASTRTIADRRLSEVILEPFVPSGSSRESQLRQHLDHDTSGGPGASRPGTLRPPAVGEVSRQTSVGSHAQISPLSALVVASNRAMPFAELIATRAIGWLTVAEPRQPEEARTLVGRSQGQASSSQAPADVSVTSPGLDRNLLAGSSAGFQDHVGSDGTAGSLEPLVAREQPTGAPHR